MKYEMSSGNEIQPHGNNSEDSTDGGKKEKSIARTGCCDGILNDCVMKVK
jgi:hypothetical protein